MNTIEAVKSINWRDVASRALWTFLQVFLATFILAGESLVDLLFNGNWNDLFTLIVATLLAGVSAGLSAVKTIVVDVMRSLNSKMGRE